MSCLFFFFCPPGTISRWPDRAADIGWDRCWSQFDSRFIGTTLARFESISIIFLEIVESRRASSRLRLSYPTIKSMWRTSMTWTNLSINHLWTWKDRNDRRYWTCSNLDMKSVKEQFWSNMCEIAWTRASRKKSLKWISIDVQHSSSSLPCSIAEFGQKWWCAEIHQ